MVFDPTKFLGNLPNPRKRIRRHLPTPSPFSLFSVAPRHRIRGASPPPRILPLKKFRFPPGVK